MASFINYLCVKLLPYTFIIIHIFHTIKNFFQINLSTFFCLEVFCELNINCRAVFLPEPWLEAQLQSMKKMPQSERKNMLKLKQ